MTEEASFGVRRLRQAITNQATCGSQFELSIDSADKLCREIEDELSRVSWAKGVPAPVDADGEVVPLTTKVMYREDGGKCKVAYWAYYPDEKDGWTAVSDVMGTKRACIPKTLHLTPPDSWERLEEDAAKRVCEYAGAQKSFVHKEEYTCINCPYDEPGQFSSKGCNERMRLDLLRRAKALVERDAKGADRG